MKKIMTMIVFVLALGSQTITAQVSSFNLKTTSNIPIKVVIDGQLVSEGAPLVSVNNIKAGYHDLHVYYQIQDYFGVREEVLFLDKIFLPPSTVTHAIINEHQQYIVERQLAMKPTPVPNQHHNPNYANNHHFDNHYATKPVFWSNVGVQAPAHCGTLPPNHINHIVTPVIMSDHRFVQLKIAIDNQWFSEGKMNVLNQALVHNNFNSQQVSELVNLFSFSKDKLDAAKKAYHNTVDQGNYFVVFESLKFNSSIQNLSNYIASL